MYIRKLLDSGKKRVNQLHKVISNRNINLSARRHLVLSVIRPSIVMQHTKPIVHFLIKAPKLVHMETNT